MNRNTETRLFIIIILIGAVLRFYRLGYSSLGMDEVYTIYATTHGFVSPGHPPLSFAILYPFITILGMSEFTARIPSSLFGIATIPLVYLLGKKVFGRGEGLIASFIVATSLWHIALSQEARMYTQLTFFVIAALYFFIEGVEKERLKAFLISVMFLILALYTHYTTLLLLPVMFFYLLISRQLFKKEIFYKTALCFVIFAIFSLPPLLSFSDGLGFKLSEGRWGLLDAYSLFFVLYEFKLGIGLSLLSFFGAVYVLTKRNTMGYLLVLYATLPLFVLSLLIFKVNIQPRYLLFTLPAYALLASYVLMELYRNVKGKTLSMGLIVIILLSFQNWGLMYDYYSHYGYFHHVARPDWNQAASFVEQSMEQEDLIASTAVAPVRYGYYPGPVEYYLRKPDFGLRDSNDFERVANSSRRVWLFIDDWTIKRIDPDQAIRGWLGRNCERKTEVELITVYLCDPSLARG